MISLVKTAVLTAQMTISLADGGSMDLYVKDQFCEEFKGMVDASESPVTLEVLEMPKNSWKVVNVICHHEGDKE